MVTVFVFFQVGRNLYIGNIEASEISLVRVEGKLKYRMLVLDSRSGNETGVAQPIAIALHPNTGKMFWYVILFFENKFEVDLPITVGT